MKYRINEIFYSVQGEGVRCGTPNVFIRFAGCNETCGYCDTEFESFKELTGEEIAHTAAKLMKEPRAVVLTGGEPALQYDQQLYECLRKENIATIAIETNGSMKLKAPVDWVCCSPKVAEHVLARSFPNGVNELKYVRHPGQAIPNPSITAEHYLISPEFRGDNPWAECVSYCLDLVKNNPKWRISLQTHKLLKIR